MASRHVRGKHSYKVSLIIVINLIKRKSIKVYSVYTIHYEARHIKVVLFLIKRFIFFWLFSFMR